MDIQKYNQNKKHALRRFIAVAVPAVLILIAVQYAVLSLVSVRKALKAVYELEDVKLLSGSFGEDTSYVSLYKEKTWLETRFQIAKTDSISLSVNLKDSVLQLELKGVVLKTSPLIDFKADQFFHQLSPAAYHHFFGVQASGESALSSIPKEPLIVKKAPKDTTEFNAQSHIEKDTLKTEAVHWMLKLDNGIVLKIEGTDELADNEWMAGKKFWWEQDFDQMKTDMRKTLFFKTPDYQPAISMVISEADAKAIYRALPQHPLICIRF